MFDSFMGGLIIGLAFSVYVNVSWGIYCWRLDDEWADYCEKEANEWQSFCARIVMHQYRKHYIEGA